MRLLLVRHGEALGAAGRCIGHTDLPLSLAGALAMRRLAANALRPLTARHQRVRLVSSDLRRAAGSAWLAAGAVRGTVESDARLRELYFGAWDGKTWAEIERADPVRLRSWLECWATTAVPGGEGLSDLLHRASTWLASNIPARESGRAGQAIVVVSHAGWIRAAVSHLLARDPSAMFDIPADHARVTVIDIGPGGPRLVLGNAERADP